MLGKDDFLSKLIALGIEPHIIYQQNIFHDDVMVRKSALASGDNDTKPAAPKNEESSSRTLWKGIEIDVTGISSEYIQALEEGSSYILSFFPSMAVKSPAK